MLLENESLDRCLSDFLRQATPGACSQLCSSLVAIIKQSIDDFRVICRFDEVASESNDSIYNVIERIPSPDADDVQSAVVFNCFMELSAYFNSEDVLLDDEIYSHTLESAAFLPETNEEFYQQKALSVIRLLSPYWLACHHHREMDHFTQGLLSLMGFISQFQLLIGQLHVEYPARSRGIKLLWRLRDEVVFAIDRIGRKFSRACFRDHCSMSAMRYELDLLMEKVHVLIDSERTKVMASAGDGRAVRLVHLMYTLSKDMNDEYQKIVLTLQDQDIEEGDEILEPSEAVRGELYNGERFAVSMHDASSFMQKQLHRYDERNNDPIIHCVVQEVGCLLEHVHAYEVFAHEALNDPWHKGSTALGCQFDLARVLLKDVAEFIDGYTMTDPTGNQFSSKLLAAEQTMAHRMFEHITYYQNRLKGDQSVHVMAPLDILVNRLQYIIFEQPIFLNAYSNLLKSVSEFDDIIEDLSDEKKTMVRPYSQMLRTHASKYADSVLRSVEKPRRHAVDQVITREFQAKMGHIIEEADQCLHVHRHPKWFRVAVRLMMSLTHFVASCVSLGDRKLHHLNRSSELYYSDYLPASSVFAHSAIDQLSRGMVLLGHDVRH